MFYSSRILQLNHLIFQDHQDVETADDKELKDLATELQIDMPTNERHLLIDRVRAELNRYLSEPVEPTPSTSRSDSVVSEVAFKKSESLVNFKCDSVLVAKEQFIRFVTKAGNEKYPKKGKVTTNY